MNPEPGITEKKIVPSDHPRPMVFWLTGFSGSGKSTIAEALKKEFITRNIPSVLLDGDVLRKGLNNDLGFTEADRTENIRRTGEVCKLLFNSGMMVIASFISPIREDRDKARAKLPKGRFIEIFVDTPLDVCESRDVKGLYKQAREGKIKNFTGIDSPYEIPLNPEVVVDTLKESVVEVVEKLISRFVQNH